MVEMRDVDTVLVQGEDQSIGQGLDRVLVLRGWLTVCFLQKVHAIFFASSLILCTCY